MKTFIICLAIFSIFTAVVRGIQKADSERDAYWIEKQAQCRSIGFEINNKGACAPREESNF